jgi:16S rRNA (guanine527-N7)-methyltransferase
MPFGVALADAIRQAAESVGVAADEGAVERLGRYVELVFKWNRIANLVGARNPDVFVAEHLADCLSIGPYVGAGSLADVGSGAGLPGVVLACMDPARHIVLVEPRAKRARFLEHVRIALALPHLTVVNARVEAWHPREPIDVCVSRALGSLGDFVRLTRAIQRPGCRLLAMKGQVPVTELAALDATRFSCRVHALDVPGRRERHLVELVVHTPGA